MSHENSGINCIASNTDEKDNNLSAGNSLGDGDDDTYNDSKDLLNSFDTSTNSVCFSQDKVRANILHNGRILDKNVKVVFKEQTGSLYNIA